MHFSMRCTYQITCVTKHDWALHFLEKGLISKLFLLDSKAVFQCSTPLSWLALVTGRQITTLIHPFTHYGLTLQMKSPSITAVDATCKRCMNIGQKPVFRSNRSFFSCDPEPLQTGNNQVCAALTSAA